MRQLQITVLLAVVLSAFFLINSDRQASPEFEIWKKDFGHSFTSEEEPFRKMIFNRNLEEINKHNSDSKQNYKKGVNQFTHLTTSEFQQMFLSSYYATASFSYPEGAEKEFTEPLTEIDWQALGKVTGVKDQGVCDAGYAFCSAGLIESFYLFDNKNVSLSEQQIIDCSANYTTFGCQGGSRIGTINYIRENGLSTSTEYPYRGSKNTCGRPSGGSYKPSYTHLQYNGCEALQNGLFTSPMTVAVNAKEWQSYKSGIFDGCTSLEVNHDTYLIGIASGYWRIKNSWGIRWGEYGYIRLKSGNTCGICSAPGFGFKK